MNLRWLSNYIFLIKIIYRIDGNKGEKTFLYNVAAKNEKEAKKKAKYAAKFYYDGEFDIIKIRVTFIEWRGDILL